MEKLLKKQIEKIVDEVLDFTLRNLEYKRIVITDSRANIGGEDKLNINYTHNKFLNKQPVIDRKIRVEIIYPYNELKDKQEGDFRLYINELLNSIRSKAF